MDANRKMATAVKQVNVEVIDGFAMLFAMFYQCVIKRGLSEPVAILLTQAYITAITEAVAKQPGEKA